MSQSSETNRNRDEITDPAEALLFIRRVIASSRGDQKGNGGIESMILFAITVAAGIATWLMIRSGFNNLALPWAIHNVTLLVVMFVAAKHREHTTRRDLQVLAIWTVTIVSLWIVTIPLSYFGLLKGSSFPLVLAFLGMGIIAGGILVWNKIEIVIGSLFILSVPVLCSIERNSSLYAIGLIAVFALAGGISELIQYKKLQNAR